jgi:phage-related protein
LTTYKFGGTALTAFGKVTLINDNLDNAERRGGNIEIPFRHGATFSQKFYGERSITFGIAMTAASATAMETLFDTLHALIAPRTEQVLEMTLEDASVRNISATVNKPLNVNRITNTLARVTIQFDCSFQFWRLSTAITDNTVTPNSNNFHFHVTNPGTVQELNPTIILTGLYTTSVTITNTTNSAVLVYTGTIAATNTVTIGMTALGEFYATHSVSGNVIGNVTHSGSSALMPIEVGLNEMQIASAGQGGNTRVQVTFNAPYL